MKEYWRAECYDSSGNYMEEVFMSEDEMKDWYEWHKDEFLISKDMSFEEFIVWQGFEEV